MKRINYIVSLVAVGLLLTTSCEDYLDAPAKSTMDKQTIFSNPDLAMNAVMGIHQAFAEQNSYRGRYTKYYGYNTDIEWNTAVEETTGAKAMLGNYNTAANNSEMDEDKNAYGKLYEGIERANQAIDGIRAYGNPQPGNIMGQILGEALTIRAIVYADLMRAWGDVPGRFEPVSTETMYIPRMDRDEMYKQLIKDLREATDLCGWPNTNVYTKSIEHINKAFVLGLKARLCMMASGYSLRQDGSIRRSTDPELTVALMYDEALKACKEVIDNHMADLENDFATPFKKNLEDNVNAGGENLWGIPYADGRGRVVFDNGIPHASKDKYTGQAKGGQYGCPLPTVFYDYDPRDTRRDVTTVHYEWAIVESESNAMQKSTEDVSKWWFGKYRYEWMKRRVTSTNDDGVNRLYMRSAELYLIAAECENEIGTLDAAKNYLRTVRNRAFAPADRQAMVEDYLAAITTKAQMFDALVDENALEFCGEAIRKENLIRWNLLSAKLAEAKAKLVELSNNTGRYAGRMPEFMYYKMDGENIIYFGLEADEVAQIEAGNIPEGFSRVQKKNKANENEDVKYRGNIKQAKIDGLYVADPDKNMYWPIWSTFISGSNNTLDNKFLNK